MNGKEVTCIFQSRPAEEVTKNFVKKAKRLCEASERIDLFENNFTNGNSSQHMLNSKCYCCLSLVPYLLHSNMYPFCLLAEPRT